MRHFSETSRESIDTLKYIGKLGAKGIKIKADATKGKEVEEMFDFIDKKYGCLDILVNNSGWTKFIGFKQISYLSEDIYNHIMDVNLKGVFLCIKCAIKLMRKSSGPSIVNIASTSGFDDSGSNIIYCASKAGVIALTKSFAKALAPHIRVNAVAPGFTQTDFISDIPKILLGFEKKLTPLRRLATSITSLYKRCENLTVINKNLSRCERRFEFISHSASMCFFALFALL